MRCSFRCRIGRFACSFPPVANGKAPDTSRVEASQHPQRPIKVALPPTFFAKEATSIGVCVWKQPFCATFGLRGLVLHRHQAWMTRFSAMPSLFRFTPVPHLVSHSPGIFSKNIRVVVPRIHANCSTRRLSSPQLVPSKSDAASQRCGDLHNEPFRSVVEANKHTPRIFGYRLSPRFAVTSAWIGKRRALARGDRGKKLRSAHNVCIPATATTVYN